MPKTLTNHLYRISGFGTMLLKDFKRHRFLYLMFLPVLVFFAVFTYWPMYGILMAFKNFSLVKGVWGSPWVGDFGFKYFIDFFTGPYFSRTVRNTLLLNLYGLLVTFPAPILFALLLNEIKNKIYKRTIQTVSYLPYFISIVVVTGIIMDFTSSTGIITNLYQVMTNNFERVNLLTKPQFFRPIYIISDVWQSIGFNSIIYISALCTISPELYESARMDGANRWKQMLHITLPGIYPTIIILFILQLGSIMSVGFEKVYLLYNESIYNVSDVISTYIYRQGLVNMRFGYSTAVGLFNSVVNFVILLTANKISYKVNKVSLF